MTDFIARAGIKNKSLVQWLVLSAVLVLLGSVIGYKLYISRQQIVQQEGHRILTQTRVIVRNMEFQFKTTNLALQGILDDLPFLSRPENRSRANARLAMLADAMPGIRTILITDVKGVVVVANRPELLGRDFSGRSYFTEPKRRQNPALLYVSPPFKSFSDVYVFNLTRMISGPRGTFAGVVTASLDPDYFDVLLRSVLYAPDMIATINHGDGIRFMVRPERPGQAGKNLAVPGSMFTRHRESGREETLLTDIGYATGEQRLMALVTMRRQQIDIDIPPCIIAGRKMSEIMRTWQEDALKEGAFFLVFCVVSVVGLVLVQRRQAGILKAERELAETRQRFVNIFDFMPDATFVVDLDMRVIAWNRAMEQMTGIPKEQMLGQGDYAYTVPFHGDRRPNLIDLLFVKDANLGDKYKNVTRKGASLFAEVFCPALYQGKGAHVWAIAAPLYDLQGEVVGAIESIRDISARKQLETDLRQSNELLASQARLDFLTNIYNRLMFNELLHAELARACRYTTTLSLIMFDLDHFKQVNDTMGHAVGDHVLKEVARLVSGRIRTHDIFCRWGGEEFMILTPKIDVVQATQLAEDIRGLIAGHDFGEALHVTASFGVIDCLCGESPELLIERVDAALYQAKNGGRNRVVAL